MTSVWLVVRDPDFGFDVAYAALTESDADRICDELKNKERRTDIYVEEIELGKTFER